MRHGRITASFCSFQYLQHRQPLPLLEICHLRRRIVPRLHWPAPLFGAGRGSGRGECAGLAESRLRQRCRGRQRGTRLGFDVTWSERAQASWRCVNIPGGPREVSKRVLCSPLLQAPPEQAKLRASTRACPGRTWGSGSMQHIQCSLASSSKLSRRCAGQALLAHMAPLGTWHASCLCHEIAKVWEIACLWL